MSIRKVLGAIAFCSLFGALLITVTMDYNTCRSNGYSHMQCSEGLSENGQRL
jgi:hypothetical protein